VNNFSSDRLTNMFCVQKPVSYKPSLSVDNLDASTSHVF
jgi:hypothetical protein